MQIKYLSPLGLINIEYPERGISNLVFVDGPEMESPFTGSWPCRRHYYDPDHHKPGHDFRFRQGCPDHTHHSAFL